MLYIEIRHDFENNKVAIETNVKKDQVKDLLSEYIRTQIGKGADDRDPNKKGIYIIRISIDLTEDTFYVNSDTGNEGLTTGIVWDAIRRINSDTVEWVG